MHILYYVRIRIRYLEYYIERLINKLVGFSVDPHATIVAGSIYLAGAVRSLVKEGALDGVEPGQGPVDDEGDAEGLPADEH